MSYSHLLDTLLSQPGFGPLKNPRPLVTDQMLGIRSGTSAAAMTASTSATSKTRADILADMQAVVDEIAQSEQSFEQRFEEEFLRIGVDLAAGVGVIFPMGTNLPAIPMRYRGQVRVANNDFMGNKAIIIPGLRDIDGPLSF